ncbi:MAG: hypothetical protein ACPGVD_06730 [Flavobacteriales bacterium]
MIKRIIIVLIVLVGFSACKKDDVEDTVVNVNSIAEDLKLVIDEKNVTALQTCCEGCSCSQTIGWGTDYSFPGDNFVRIQDDYYYLNRLIRYEIKTVGTSTKEVRMVLYFPSRSSY